jgi:ribA/ribD-fused uncharacterized protein
MRETDTHIYFWGTFLSNWIPKDCEIYFENPANRNELYCFKNSEQLFMWLKAIYFNDEAKARDIFVKGGDPRVAKDLGREVKGYDEDKWSLVREEKMYTAVMAKFQSSEELKNKLLATGDKILVEGTPFDPIWGVMIKWDDDRILDEKNWKGQNLLGKVLMNVRKKLKDEK